MSKTNLEKEQEIESSCIFIKKLKTIRLDENKKYKIKAAIIQSALDTQKTIKKFNAQLEQQTDWFFSFSIYINNIKRIITIDKFDYIKNPSLIEVVA